MTRALLLKLLLVRIHHLISAVIDHHECFTAHVLGHANSDDAHEESAKKDADDAAKQTSLGKVIAAGYNKRAPANAGANRQTKGA